MAEMRERRGTGRSQYSRMENSRTYAYVDGTAVRKLAPTPTKRPQKKETVRISNTAKRNREYALAMHTGYVLFLTAAAVITVFMCVRFLRLQAQGTRLQKQVTALEIQLDAAILENESDYNRIMTSVDMEHVKNVAMNELGMVYAKKSQIVTYEAQNGDYVRQYAEIPAE